MLDNVALQLDNIGMAYKRRAGFMRYETSWALRKLSFEVHSGESLGIIGRNGAGKSSLLRLLAGISKPSEGSITTRSSFVALLSLNLGFIPNLSGRQNVRISGMLYGLDRAHIEELLPAIVEYSELKQAIDHPVATYSAGMKARLGFATATVVEPDILLIDEILGVGDLSFRKKSSATMRNRLKSDKTAIFVSHNMNEVRALCDRVIWLEHGALHMSGSPDEVISAYERSMGSP
ncbi:MAG: ABC transporter ATP-binding protein [Halieaceae bacterium]